MLGVVGLPIPEETLLTFAGFPVYKGVLHLVPTFRLGGVRVMVLATTALVLPSFTLIMSVLAILVIAWQNNPLMKGVLQGITAGVESLLLAALCELVKQAPRHWCCLVVSISEVPKQGLPLGIIGKAPFDNFVEVSTKSSTPGLHLTSHSNPVVM